MSNLRDRYLDPALLQALGNMQVRARTLVEGVIAGMHRSPHRGGSVEFAEYTEYSPGQELRHIDWRVYGKSDKYYIKQFQDETNLRVFLVMDGSGSMAFKSETAPWSKQECVSLLAAALGYLVIRQGDAVGAVQVVSDPKVPGKEEVQFLPASSKSTHLEDLFFLLEKMPGKGDAGLLRALQTVVERARGRCRVLIFSDMLDANEDVLTMLKILKRRRFDLTVFHVVDPAEMDLPYEGLTIFEGMEDDGELLAEADDLREQYRAAIQGHFKLVESTCHESNIEYFRFLTSEPLEEVALKFLRGHA